MTEAQLLVMAQACRQHLTLAERALIQRAAAERFERLYAYLVLRGGTSMTTREFAGFMLRCAQRALEAGGAS